MGRASLGVDRVTMLSDTDSDSNARVLEPLRAEAKTAGGTLVSMEASASQRPGDVYVADARFEREGEEVLRVQAIIYRADSAVSFEAHGEAIDYSLSASINPADGSAAFDVRVNGRYHSAVVAEGDEIPQEISLEAHQI